jgi:chromate transporter
MEDWLQWVIAAACFLVTVAVQAEVAVLSVACGLIGVLYYGSLFRRRAAVPEPPWSVE